MLARRSFRLAFGVVIVLMATSLYYLMLPERPHRNPAPSPAWSRAVQLGSASLINVPSLALDGQGGVRVVWVGSDGGNDRLFLARLDDQGMLKEKRVLDLPVRYPQYPEVEPDRRGGLHLTWLDGSEGIRKVRYVRLDADGQPQGGSVAVSGGAVAAGWADMVVGQDEGVVVFWSGPSPRDPGIYATRLDGKGRVLEMDSLIAPGGVFPAARQDGRGNLHLVWLDNTSNEASALLYARVDAGAPLVLAPRRLVNVPFGSAIQPTIGLDRSHTYVFWQQRERRLDGSTPQVVYYVSFPSDSPTDVERREVRIDDPPGTEYRPADTAGPSTADHVSYPAVSGGRERRAFFALSARLRSLRHEPTLLVQGQLAEGRVQSYRQASTGRIASLAPAVGVDEHDQLHLVWLEGRGENDYPVRYATTTPAAIATLAERSRQDLRDFVAWGAITVVAALAFTPFILLLNALGFGLLVVLAYWRGTEGRVRGWELGLALALQSVVYVGFGQALIPSETFGEWLPAGWLVPVTMYFYPFVCVGVGIAALVVYGRQRAGTAGLFGSYLVFALASGWVAALILFYYLLPRL